MKAQPNLDWVFPVKRESPGGDSGKSVPLPMQKEAKTYRVELGEPLEKLTFEWNKPLCFNHHSAIENFFPRFTWEGDISPADLNRERRSTKWKSILIDELVRPEKDRTHLTDWDYLSRIKDAFRQWRGSYWSNPMLAHAHGYSLAKNGEMVPIEGSWQLLTRFDSNRNIQDLSDALYQHIKENSRAKGVFLTLTLDPALSGNLKDSWENIARYWHTFMVRLRREIEKSGSYPELNYIWVLEAQGNGYPHIHALFLGIDWLYWAGNKSDWLEDGPHSKNLKHFWKWGSVFINRSQHNEGIRSPIDYMMKYIRKTFNQDPDPSGKKILTQSLLWLFNKRSFNLSRGLFDYLGWIKPMKKTDLKLVSISRYRPLGPDCSTPFVRIITLKPAGDTGLHLGVDPPIYHDKQTAWLFREHRLKKFELCNREIL